MQRDDEEAAPRTGAPMAAPGLDDGADATRAHHRAAAMGAARLAAVCELTTDFVLVTDPSRHVVYANAAAARALVFDVGDGPVVCDLYVEDCRSALAESFATAERDGSWSGELVFRGRDGSVPVSQVTLAHRGGGGVAEHYSIVARDISGEKAIERELTMRSAKLRSLVEQAVELVVVCDRAGVVTDAGESLVELLGYSPSEWMGRSVGEFVHHDDADKWRGALDRVLDAGSGAHEEVLCRIRRRDDSWCWLESRVTNLLDDPAVGAIVAVSWDKTERAEMAEALRASEERFRSLAASSPLGIVYADADGVVEYVNPRWREISGVGPDETPTWDRLHPDDRERVVAESTAALRAGEEISTEYRVVRPDGEIRHVRSSAAPVLDRRGVVTGFIGSVQDVSGEVAARVRTDRLISGLKEVEARLAASESWFRSLVQEALDVVSVRDATNRLVYVSPSVARVLGHEPGDVIGETSRVIEVHPDDRDAARRSDRQVREHPDATVRIEYRLRHRDGSWRWVESRLTNLLDDPVVAGIVTNFQDITDRRAAEEALRSSEERFRSLVQHSSDFVVVYTAEGTVSYASPSVVRFCGYDVEELNAPTHPALTHPDDQPIVVGHLAELEGDAGGTGTFEVRMRRHDGQYRWVEITATNLLRDPNVGGFVLNARDVTERRETAEALAATNEALRDSEEKYRALVQHGSDMVTVLNADGTVRYASPAGARVMGYPEGWGIGMNPTDLMHPDDLDRISESFVRALTEPGITGPEELRLRHADGTYRFVEAVANNLVGDPAVNGVIITAHDVTARKEAEEQVRRSEARLRALVQNLSDVITVVDEHGKIQFTSPASGRLFGFEEHDETWTDPLSTVHPDDREHMSAEITRQLQGEGVTEPVRFRLRHRDGSFRSVEALASNLLDDAAVRGIVVTTRDVTERTRAETIVSAQARVLELIARGADLTETLTATCQIVEDLVSESLCSVLRVDEARGRLVTAAAPSLPARYVEALAGGVPIAEGEGSCGTAASRNAEVVVTDVTIDPSWSTYRELATRDELRACWSTPIIASSGDRVLGTFAVYWRETRTPNAEDRRVVDLMVHLAAIAIERKTFEEQLAFQAHHDPLTGLPNRTLFLEFLSLALARARRRRSSTAVLFLDLDRFKDVNDSLGHDRGDELLVSVGRRLQGVLRPGDTIARFGGDEFTVLCEDLAGPDARQQAIDLAERLLEAIHEPFPHNGDERFLSASVGIAVASGVHDRPDGLLRDADAAMYRAKERGKARWELFDEQMRASAQVRLETESALHRALDRREFRLVYQPVVSLREARYVGVEALVRWEHPERGLVAPREFVTLAEETGLIVPLGAWVLQEVCLQFSEWRRQLVDAGSLVVSVNLSGKQIAQPDLVDTVSRSIALAGIDPANLCLEITESVLLDDTGPALRTLRALKELGVQLSMDDFGTGYSSLGYLKRFPIDSVKVDRSFVDGLGTDPEDSAIVAGVVSLGHALGLTVVGEGVETRQQLAELVALGCHEAQGYYFSSPQPADRLDLSLSGRDGPRRVPGAELMGDIAARGRVARR